MPFKRAAGVLSAVTVLLAGAGCEVTPEPLPRQEIADRARSDLAYIRSAEFEPTAPITLHEAMARAVVYNLKRRVSYIERRIEEAELAQSNYEMLPTLELSAGRNRSDVQISPSDDRITKSANATFTWNILDLGVSYARAKQRADEVLIARERERKALQDIIRQVNVAFWRVASGQVILSRVKALAKDLRTAIRASRDMERDRATDVLSAVAFRRDIVESIRKALAVQRELNEAKVELAELLNIRPGHDFKLVMPATPVGMSQLPMSIPDMERHSLRKRPELRIESYNERISEWQAREALYDMLPGLDVSVARNYSSESSNLSPNWVSTGLQLGMNLFNLFSGSSKMDAAERRGELARQQRLAMSVAVLTQVHIALAKYREAQQQMRLVSELANSDRRLARLVRADGNYLNTNFLDAVRLETRHLQSEMEAQRAQTDLVSAHADLMHAIGLDAVPETVPLQDMAALKGSIASMLATWNLPSGQERRNTASSLDQLVDSMIARPDPGKEKAVARQAVAMGRKALQSSRLPNEPQPAGLVARLNSIAPAARGPAAAPASRRLSLDWEVALGPEPARLSSRSKPATAGYIVSLGAYREQFLAFKLRDALASISLPQLEGVNLEVVFRTGGKGTAFYYVQTAGLKDRRRARNLCLSLNRIGRDCFVARERP